MVYETVYCCECEKPVKAVPAWLAGVKVRFSCEACRQKHPKAYAPVDLVGVRVAKSEDDDALGDLPTDEDGIVDPVEEEQLDSEVEAGIDPLVDVE